MYTKQWTLSELHKKVLHTFRNRRVIDDSWGVGTSLRDVRRSIARYREVSAS